MNTSAKGRRNEHRGRDFFIALGYKVVRSAGSFGLADFVAFGEKRIYVVNGKTNQWAPPGEREELRAWVKTLGRHALTAILMRFDDGDTTPKFKVVNVDGTETKVTHEFFGR